MLDSSSLNFTLLVNNQWNINKNLFNQTVTKASFLTNGIWIRILLYIGIVIFDKLEIRKKKRWSTCSVFYTSRYTLRVKIVSIQETTSKR